MMEKSRLRLLMVPCVAAAAVSVLVHTNSARPTRAAMPLRTNVASTNSTQPDVAPSYLPPGAKEAAETNASAVSRNRYWTLPVNNPYTGKPLAIFLQQFAGTAVSPLASDYTQRQLTLGGRVVYLRSPQNGFGAYVITWQSNGTVYELVTERLEATDGQTVGLSLEELQKVGASIT